MQEKITGALTAKLSQAFGAVNYGDPLEDATLGTGSLINSAVVERVHGMVARAVVDGAAGISSSRRC